MEGLAAPPRLEARAQRVVRPALAVKPGWRWPAQQQPVVARLAREELHHRLARP
jgi:hypothetical protein